MSDDPTQPDGRVFAIDANPAMPCLEVTPLEGLTSYTYLDLYTSSTATFQLTVCNEHPVVVSDIAMVDASNGEAPHPGYDLDLADFVGTDEGTEVSSWGQNGAPTHLTLQPGESRSFDVIYTLDADIPFDLATGEQPAAMGWVSVDAMAFMAPFERLVTTKVKCIAPFPVITSVDGLEVEVRTTLTLSGADSVMGAGMQPIDVYAWTVTQPSGASGVFADPTAATTTFTPTVPGTYVFSLAVADPQGRWSCVPATRAVVVTPVESFYVSLTWEGAPEDTGTMDLDLHLVHPDGGDLTIADSGQAEGLCTQNSCYWNNTSPDWWPLGFGGDPSLAVESLDAPGPEVIHIATPPTENMTYTIGVYYYKYSADVSPTPSQPATANVQVFIDGALAWESGGVPVDVYGLWIVGSVTLPTGEVAPADGGGGAPLIHQDYQDSTNCTYF